MERTVALPHDLTSASLARRYVERFGSDEKLDDETMALAATVVTELVTNAILHGSRPVELSLRRAHDEITIEVSDGDPTVAQVRVRSPHDGRRGGRGLLLVSKLAERWGSNRSEGGKVVWASIHTRAR